MNVLYEQFPESVTVHGIRYPIVTDFREWIRFSELIDDADIPWNVKCNLMLQWYAETIPEDIEAAVYVLGDFLAARELYPRSLKSTGEAGSGKPVFSFSDDAGCIYSAFIDCYGIDVQAVPHMHWWKFRTLFDGLPEDTEIKQRMMYRSIDVRTIKDKSERSRIRRIQQAIAIQKKGKKIDDYEIGEFFA